MVELNDMCMIPSSCPIASKPNFQTDNVSVCIWLVTGPRTVNSVAVTAPPTTPPPTPMCTNGKVFHTCGTACPRTCDNYQQQSLPCTHQCVRGCFCPDGMVEIGNSCVPPDQCPSMCWSMNTYTCTTHPDAVTDAPIPPCTALCKLVI